jgi:hypothetical protein
MEGQDPTIGSLRYLAASTYLKYIIASSAISLQGTKYAFRDDQEKLSAECRSLLASMATNMHFDSFKRPLEGYPLIAYASNESAMLFCINELGLLNDSLAEQHMPSLNLGIYAYISIARNYPRLFKLIDTCYRRRLSIDQPEARTQPLASDTSGTSTSNASDDEQLSEYYAFLAEAYAKAQLFGTNGIKRYIRQRYPALPQESPDNNQLLINIRRQLYSDNFKPQLMYRFADYLKHTKDGLQHLGLLIILNGKIEYLDTLLKTYLATTQSPDYRNFSTLLKYLLYMPFTSAKRQEFLNCFAQYPQTYPFCADYNELILLTPILSKENLRTILPLLPLSYLNHMSAESHTIISKLCIRRSTADIKYILEVLPNLSLEHHPSALHTAVAQENIELVKFLLEKGISIRRIIDGTQEYWPFEYATTDQMRKLLITSNACVLEEPTLCQGARKLLIFINSAYRRAKNADNAFEKLVDFFGLFSQAQWQLSMTQKNGLQQLLWRLTKSPAGFAILRQLPHLPLTDLFTDSSSFLIESIIQENIPLTTLLLTRLRHFPNSDEAKRFINRTTDEGDTALHLAIRKIIEIEEDKTSEPYKKWLSVIHLLLKNDASRIIQNKARQFPLQQIPSTQNTLKADIEAYNTLTSSGLDPRKRKRRAPKQFEAHKLGRSDAN